MIDLVVRELREMRADKAASNSDDWVDVREQLTGVLEDVDDGVSVVDTSGVPVDGVPDADIPDLVAYYRAKGMVG